MTYQPRYVKQIWLKSPVQAVTVRLLTFYSAIHSLCQLDTVRIWNTAISFTTWFRSLAYSSALYPLQMSEPDVEMNYDDELDFGLDGLFEDEPPAEEAVLAPAAAAAAEPAEPEQPEPAEPGPSVGVTRTGKGKAKAKAKKR